MSDLRLVDPSVIIELPHEIANSSLSLEEIGILTCLLCVTCEEGVMKRLNSDEGLAAIKSLQEKQVLKLEMEGKTLKMKFELEVLGL